MNLLEEFGSVFRAFLRDKLAAGGRDMYDPRLSEVLRGRVSKEMWNVTDVLVGPRRVLVVEDDADNAEMLRTFLQLDRHEVKVAHDGPSAIEVAGTYRPDAALVDVGLPGMDGLEVARRLRELRGAGLLLVALTGHAREEDRRQALASGFNHHFTKPLDLIALRKVLTP